MRIILMLLLLTAPCLATFPGENGKIIFTANSSGTWQIYTINPDGTDMTQLTNLPATTLEGWFPDFSPDGERIVFCYGATQASPAVEVHVMNADGSDITQVTHDGGFDCPTRWSPNGRRIAFARGPFSGNSVIATMRADGTDIVNLTNPLWGAFAPTYTPDGAEITYVSSEGGLIGAVWIMGSNGVGQHRLTPAALEGFPADVSPNGKHILVISHVSTTYPNQIYRMNLNGTDLTQLTFPHGGHNDIPGTYSPDGTKIMFASDRLSSNKSLDLFVMNADGTDIHRIASGLTVGGCPSGNCVTPSWGPKP